MAEQNASASCSGLLHAVAPVTHEQLACNYNIKFLAPSPHIFPGNCKSECGYVTAEFHHVAVFFALGLFLTADRQYPISDMPLIELHFLWPGLSAESTEARRDAVLEVLPALPRGRDEAHTRCIQQRQ